MNCITATLPLSLCISFNRSSCKVKWCIHPRPIISVAIKILCGLHLWFYAFLPSSFLALIVSVSVVSVCRFLCQKSAYGDRSFGSTATSFLLCSAKHLNGVVAFLGASSSGRVSLRIVSQFLIFDSAFGFACSCIFEPHISLLTHSRTHCFPPLLRVETRHSIVLLSTVYAEKKYEISFSLIHFSATDPHSDGLWRLPGASISTSLTYWYAYAQFLKAFFCCQYWITRSLNKHNDNSGRWSKQNNSSFALFLKAYVQH